MLKSTKLNMSTTFWGKQIGENKYNIGNEKITGWK